MFIIGIAIVFIIYSILILFSIKDGITKEMRQSMGPQDLEIIQTEIDYREYWAVLLLLFSALILLPKIIFW